MTDATTTLRDLFAVCRDPVFGVREGKIAFFNSAAESFFDSKIQNGMSAEEFLPKQLISYRAGGFTSSAIMQGERMVASCTPFEGVLVYTLNPESETPALPSAALIGSMRSTIFTMRMAFDKLISPAEFNGDDRLMSYYSVLYHNYHQLLHFVGNLHSAESILNDTLPFRPSLENIVSICRELTRSSAALLADEGIELSFECESKSIMGSVDRQCIEQLLLNLISNSVKSVSKGGRIVISLSTEGDSYTIRVTDSGPGIPPELLRHVFTCYSKGKPESEVQGGHTGLGLYIVRGIAELHGGAVLIDNVEIGASVRIVLPLSAETHMVLRSTELEYRAAALNSILTELSVCLDHKYYKPELITD